MLRTVFFMLCLSVSSTISAQMKLLDEPKSKSGVDAVTDAKDFLDSANTFIGFDDLEAFSRVNDQYKKLGVTFSSSNTDDSVAVMPYAFADGKSGKFSIASKKPQYQGKMTIAFDGIKIASVGFHLSHVNSGGTLVDAYAKNDKFLGRFGIPKNKVGTVFFGMKSKTPIAKLIISPVKPVDEDFAIDDLAFTKIAK